MVQRRLCINRGLAKLLDIEDCANPKEWFAVTDEMAGQREDKEDSGEAHAEGSEKSANGKG